MAEIPNLRGVVQPADCVTKGDKGKFAVTYLPWSRCAQLMQEYANGWFADCIPAEGGGLLHDAPNGCYLLIRFVHVDGTVTPAFPQAVMGNQPVLNADGTQRKNKAGYPMNDPNGSIPSKDITSRDVTDTQRRGFCLAAAMVFGLGAELWAGNLSENPYRPDQAEPVSGNGKSVPATQQETSSNGSKPPASEFIMISGDPELDGEIRPEVVFHALRSVNKERRQLIKDGFMAAHYPSIFEAAQKEKKPVAMGPKNVNTDELLADLVERIHQTNPTLVAA